MFGDGGLRQADLIDNVATDAALFFIQHLDNAQPGGVRESSCKDSNFYRILHFPGQNLNFPDFIC